MKKRIGIALVAGILVFTFAYAQVAAGVMFLRKRLNHITQSSPDGAGRVVQELTTELNLTPEQQGKAKDIVLQAKNNIENALTQAGAAIDNLLTDEQKVKFEETRKKIRDEIKPGAIKEK